MVRSQRTRLRAESAEEAILARDRVNKMGVKCEIETCDWSGGRPKHGHYLQEAAREMRYGIFLLELHFAV
ncbi:unnamed protein product [Musa acuminata subsp. malaccensis]|uniref:(wild Malaysian banana) hypothetical protein n=1 Tax=Musa acuminata subsp. malaccensis TaxID=214687 RepID=A0A804JZ37_MUSAM|nr:unnamed protein product [Musa acuminata subsp. malaccensis]